jgi:hypothetical protein
MIETTHTDRRVQVHDCPSITIPTGLAPALAGEACSQFTTVVKNAPREGVEWALREIGPTTLVALQGCSTLSIEFPVEERIGSGESSSISILTEC